jgi:hypothetical protein
MRIKCQLISLICLASIFFVFRSAAYAQGNAPTIDPNSQTKADINRLDSEISTLKATIEKQRTLEDWVKIVTAILAIFAIVSGVLQYRATTNNDFKKTFWKEQVALYQEACDAAAAIAMSSDLEDSANDRRVFWRLYWGKLSIIEHPEVRDAMVAFGRQLYEVEYNNSKPHSLRQLSYHLARSCRSSLKKTWNPVDIGDLDENMPTTSKDAA